MSTTRWSARIESVRPVSAYLPGILSALEDLEKLNLTAEIQSEIHGIKESFQCILMASIWVKVLTATEIKYCKPEVQLWILKLETYKVLLKI